LSNKKTGGKMTKKQLDKIFNDMIIGWFDKAIQEHNEKEKKIKKGQSTKKIK
jgi:hypothetical protein